MSTTETLPVVTHWTDGASYESTSGRTADVYDPALGVVTQRVALAGPVEISIAVVSAQAAFPDWRNTTLENRPLIMFGFRELLYARKCELAEIITSEHGKVVSCALGEISRGQEVLEFACGLAHHLEGS